MSARTKPRIPDQPRISGRPITALIAALAIGLLAASAWAEATAPAAGQPPANGGRRYDPAAEVTITGVVSEVKKTPCATCPGGRMGLHLVVISADGPVDVRLGPNREIRERGMQFAAGDEVTVVGAKTANGESTRIVARQVKAGNKTYTLRDASGAPVWAAARKSPPAP